MGREFVYGRFLHFFVVIKLMPDHIKHINGYLGKKKTLRLGT